MLLLMQRILPTTRGKCKQSMSVGAAENHLSDTQNKCKGATNGGKNSEAKPLKSLTLNSFHQKYDWRLKRYIFFSVKVNK